MDAHADPGLTFLAEATPTPEALALDDAQIFAVTCFVAFRVPFSTVNDALGALPDHQLGESAAPPVREAITWGRPIGQPTA
jgi:hypothetical protein